MMALTSGNKDYAIVPLRREQLDEVVVVHMRSFPDFFLTFLGRRFLREFYGSFLDDDMGMAFVSVENESGRIMGSVVGSLVPDGYFKRLLKRRWWAFCLASTGAVLRRPWIIGRLFRAVFYRGESPEAGPVRSLLSSISVDPQDQGKGVGAALMAAWEAEAHRRGSHGVFLTTDAQGNDTVNRFYRRLGWTLESTFTTPQGRQMNRYTKDFQE